MLEQSYYDEADKIIAAYGTEPRFLIPIIQDIQSEYKYLPPELCGGQTEYRRGKSLQCSNIL